MKVNLRTPVILTLTVAFGLLATGCGTTTPTKVAQTPIRIWRYNQPVDPIKQTIDEYQKANTSLDISYTSNTLDTYETDALKSLASRQGPDIWSIPSDWLGDEEAHLVTLPANYYLDKNKKALDTTNTVRTSYPDGIADQLVRPSDNKVLGIPTNVDTLILYYNPNLFTTAFQDYLKTLGKNPPESETRPVQQLLSTPPVTWDSLKDQIKYVTVKNGDSISRSAIALGAADNIPNAIDTLELLMLQNGAKIISTDRKQVMFADATTSDSGAVYRLGAKALDFFAGFSNPTNELYSWSPAMPPAIDAFAKGKVAMVIAYSDFAQQLKVKYPKFPYKTAAVPQVSTSEPPVNLIKFSVETVTATAASATSSFNFMKLYTTESKANTLASESKTFTPYKTVLTKNAATSFQAKQILTGQTVYKKNRVMFDSAFKQMIVDVTQNEISSEDAIKTASDAITQLYLPATPNPNFYEKK